MSFRRMTRARCRAISSTPGPRARRRTPSWQGSVVGVAIDEVTDRDDHVVGHCAHDRQQLLELGEAAVDVADDDVAVAMAR